MSLSFVQYYVASNEFYTILYSCRKIPRDLTEASLSGAGLSIVAAFSIIFLFGMVGSSPFYIELISRFFEDVKNHHICSPMFDFQFLINTFVILEEN